MSDSNQPTNEDVVSKATTPRKRRTSTRDTNTLQKLLALDPMHKTFKKITIAFIVAVAVFAAAVSVAGILFTNEQQTNTT